MNLVDRVIPSITVPRIGSILIGAFLLRCLWMFFIPINPVSDGLTYEIFATNIATHGVFGFTPEQPGAYWAVGASAIYAGSYLLFGIGSAKAVLIVNMVSSMFVVWGLHRLGRLYFDETVGRIAALLFAIWPLAIEFTTVMASEIHFVALLVGGLIAWEKSQQPRISWGYLVLSALFFAAATYVRPIALLVPSALAFAAVCTHPRIAFRPILSAALVTALIFLAVAPWSARNERVFGEPVFVSTNFWANFWMGNNPGSNGEYTPEPKQTQGKGEIEASRIIKEMAINDLKADPTGFIWRTMRKILILHQRETIGVAWNKESITDSFGAAALTPLKIISTLYWYVVLAGAFVGIMVLGRQNGVRYILFSPPVILWAYFTMVHAIIVVGDRYHMPAIPMIAILAAVSFQRLQQFLQNRAANRAANRQAQRP